MLPLDKLLSLFLRSTKLSTTCIVIRGTLEEIHESRFRQKVKILLDSDYFDDLTDMVVIFKDRDDNSPISMNDFFIPGGTSFKIVKNIS